MASKAIATVLLVLAMSTAAVATTTMSIVEKELREFRAALRAYQASTNTTRFRDPEDVKQALTRQMEFKSEKLNDGKILDPWRSPYIFTTAVDGSLVIVSLGNPAVLPAKPYVLVVQPPAVP